MHQLHHVCFRDTAIGQQCGDDVLRFDARNPRQDGSGAAFIVGIPFDREVSAISVQVLADDGVHFIFAGRG
ncbi:hypothetical protein D3C72_2145350 [compost metagenome]